MRKYGKYEKRPAAVPAKQAKPKGMLLQAYFVSLLGLVLCVTMFFGTSYAWFTSEVNNTSNEIYVGTLKVGLYKGSENLDNSDTKLFDRKIPWEPGYTALETIKITNEGDLAFKYVLKFTNGALATESNMNLSDVAKYFDVWVYDHSKNENSGFTYASYADITTENGWNSVGTLAELLNGTSVLEGKLETVSAEAEYTIALHMTEDAASSVMGQKISLNVKLVAYQMAYEPEKND